MLALQDGNSLLRHQIGKLIGSLGEEKFESELLSTLNKIFRVDLYSVFPFDRDERLHGPHGSQQTLHRPRARSGWPLL